MSSRFLYCAVLACIPALGADEVTLYDLLPPDIHQFAITYDVTATREGSRFYFNPIRPGSVASNERVIERSTGKELKWEIVNGRDAKTSGLVPASVSDGAQYLKVQLPGPVPHGGET